MGFLVWFICSKKSMTLAFKCSYSTFPLQLCESRGAMEFFPGPIWVYHNLLYGSPTPSARCFVETGPTEEKKV